MVIPNDNVGGIVSEQYQSRNRMIAHCKTKAGMKRSGMAV